MTHDRYSSRNRNAATIRAVTSRCLTMTQNSLIMHEIKVVYESDMHLVEKRSSDIEGLA